jgi:hypothetical protein
MSTLDYDKLPNLGSQDQIYSGGQRVVGGCRAGEGGGGVGRWWMVVILEREGGRILGFWGFLFLVLTRGILDIL